MHKELKHKDLVSCLSRTFLFYSITLQCSTWKHIIIMERYKGENYSANFWKD